LEQLPPAFVAVRVKVVNALGFTFSVPEAAVDKVVKPSLNETEVALVVVQVRSKPVAATAAVRSQVGGGGGGGSDGVTVTAWEQLPPAFVAVNVKIVVALGVTFKVPDRVFERVNTPSLNEAVVAFVVAQVRSKLSPAPSAAVRIQVGAGGIGGVGGESVISLEQLPPAPVAVSV
jgi:hypothetical protein